MAEIKAPIKIDGFKCVDDVVQAVLNYTYKGKTLKEWADSISKPQTNADCIRSITDEELEKWYWWMHKEMMCATDSRTFVHNWLRQEVNDGD